MGDNEDRFAWSTRNYDVYAGALAKDYAERSDPDIAWRIFVAWSRAGEWAKAAEWGRKGLDAHASHWRWRSAKDDMAWATMLAGEYEDAAERWGALAKRGGDFGRKAKFYHGFSLHRAKRHEEAVEALGRLVDRKSAYNAPAHYWRSKALAALGKAEDAHNEAQLARVKDRDGWYVLLLDNQRMAGASVELPDPATLEPTHTFHGRWAGDPAPVRAPARAAHGRPHPPVARSPGGPDTNATTEAARRDKDLERRPHLGRGAGLERNPGARARARARRRTDDHRDRAPRSLHGLPLVRSRRRRQGLPALHRGPQGDLAPAPRGLRPRHGGAVYRRRPGALRHLRGVAPGRPVPGFHRPTGRPDPRAEPDAVAVAPLPAPRPRPLPRGARLLGPGEARERRGRADRCAPAGLPAGPAGARLAVGPSIRRRPLPGLRHHETGEHLPEHGALACGRHRAHPGHAVHRRAGRGPAGRAPLLARRPRRTRINLRYGSSTCPGCSTASTATSPSRSPRTTAGPTTSAAGTAPGPPVRPGAPSRSTPSWRPSSTTRPGTT